MTVAKLSHCYLKFHGYSSNAENHHRGRADFRGLSEEDNFILVVPQGSLFEGVTHWNVGANKTRQMMLDLPISLLRQ